MLRAHGSLSLVLVNSDLLSGIAPAVAHSTDAISQNGEEVEVDAALLNQLGKQWPMMRQNQAFRDARLRLMVAQHSITGVDQARVGTAAVNGCSAGGIVECRAHLVLRNGGRPTTWSVLSYLLQKNLWDWCCSSFTG